MAPTDSDLLDRWIARRDPEAFAQLVARYAGLVYGTAMRIVRNDADAEDIVQDCFLRLARERVPPRSSLAGYLHANATGRAIDWVRSKERRRRREQSFARERTGTASGASVSGSSASSSWVSGDVLAEVDVGMTSLPAEFREPLVEHFLRSRTQAAIAQDLGVSRQTITRRIAKGLELLQRALSRRGVTATAGVIAATLEGASASATVPSSVAELAASSTWASVPSTATTVVTSAKTWGGFFVAKRIIVSFVIAVSVIGGLYVALSGGGPAPDSPGADAMVDRSEDERLDPLTELATVDEDRPESAEVLESIESGSADGSSERRIVGGVVVDGAGSVVPDAALSLGARDGPVVRRVATSRSDASGEFAWTAASVAELLAGSGEVGETVWITGHRDDVGAGAVQAPRAEFVRGDGPNLQLRVVLEPIGTVGGRVYDRSSGESIEGIQLRLRQVLPEDGRDAERLRVNALASLVPSLSSADELARTGPDGRYRFRATGTFEGSLAFPPSPNSDYVLPGFRRGDPPPSFSLEPGAVRTDIDFALDVGGAIEGRVIDPHGEPVEAVSVELVPSYRTRVSRRVETAADGSFRFSGLATGAKYRAQAWRPESAPCFSETVEMPAAEIVTGVEIVLADGQQVLGRIEDDAGAPVPDAAVVLAARFESRLAYAGFDSVTSDVDGHFAVGPLTPGEYSLAVRAEGLVDGRREFSVSVDEQTEELVVVLRRPAPGFIAGVVRDQNEDPAEVAVVVRHGGRRVGVARSSPEDGAFRVEGLEAETGYVVTALSREHWGERVLEVARDRDDVVVPVHRRGRLVGRVVDAATQEPVPHFEFRVAHTRPDGNQFHTSWRPVDHADGAFVYDGAEPGPVESVVHVRADGYVVGRSGPVFVPSGGETETVAVRIDRGARVAGRVVDAATGEPLLGVRVRSYGRAEFTTELLDAERDSWRGDADWRLGMTDADGRFELPGLRPGSTVQLAFWKPGYGTAVERGVTVEAGAGRDVEIRMSRGAVVAAEIGSIEGFGPSIELELSHRETRPWSGGYTERRRVGKRGVVEWKDLPAGAYRLWVVRSGSSPSVSRGIGELRWNVESGRRLEVRVDLNELRLEVGEIRGVLRVAGDRERVAIRVRSEADSEEWFSFGPVRCDEAGRFGFQGLPPGPYVVTAEVTKPERRTARKRVRVVAGESTEVEIQLSR